MKLTPWTMLLWSEDATALLLLLLLFLLLLLLLIGRCRPVLSPNRGTKKKLKLYTIRRGSFQSRHFWELFAFENFFEISGNFLHCTNFVMGLFKELLCVFWFFWSPQVFMETFCSGTFRFYWFLRFNDDFFQFNIFFDFLHSFAKQMNCNNYFLLTTVESVFQDNNLHLFLHRCFFCSSIYSFNFWILSMQFQH